VAAQTQYNVSILETGIIQLLDNCASMEQKCRKMCAMYGNGNYECGKLYNFISEIHSIRSTTMAEHAGLR